MNKPMGLIIQVGGGGDNQGMDMMNSICLGDKAYPDAKDGDIVETNVKGKIMIHDDGSKYLVAEETDGIPVMSMDQEDAQDNGSDEQSEPDANSSDALDTYMKNKGK